MRNTTLLIILLISVIATSCIRFERSHQRYGFDCDFNNDGKGLVMVSVDCLKDELWLKGDVTVDKGAIDVYLKSPGGDTIFNKTFTVSQKVAIDTIIEAKTGAWSLIYKSHEGSGQLYLYIDYPEF
jgi:hypothetical protein